MKPIPGVPAGLGLLVLLAGCADPALDRGLAPPIVLSQTSVTVAMAQSAYGASYRDAIASLGGGAALHAIRARIDTSFPSRARVVRAQLLGDGLDPDRIGTSGLPGDRVVFTRMRASVADCRMAEQPAFLGDVSQSLDAVARCQQAAALADDVADPADLRQPAALGQADGAKAAAAVIRWERDDTKEAPSGAGADGGAGAGGASADSAGSGAAGSVQSAPVAAGNPLLSPTPLSPSSE